MIWRAPGRKGPPTANHQRLAATLAAGVILLILSHSTACTVRPQIVRAYPGPARPREHLATVKAMDEGFQFGGGVKMHVEKVDGVFLDPSHLSTYEVELLPGTRTLEVSFERMGNAKSVSNLRLVFEAEAGHVYEVRGTDKQSESILDQFAGRGLWTAWIVDLNNGAVVAGEAP
jgi:hypothetical protein